MSAQNLWSICKSYLRISRYVDCSIKSKLNVHQALFQVWCKDPNILWNCEKSMESMRIICFRGSMLWRSTSLNRFMQKTVLNWNKYPFSKTECQFQLICTNIYMHFDFVLKRFKDLLTILFIVTYWLQEVRFDYTYLITDKNYRMLNHCLLHPNRTLYMNMIMVV